VLICSAGGKFFTVLGDNFARGKGHGESIKLMVDIDNHDVINIMPYVAVASLHKLLLASTKGKGFIINSDDAVASTKNGKQIMQVSGDDRCVVCTSVSGDMVAVIGTNRKLLFFSIDEVPEMKRVASLKG